MPPAADVARAERDARPRGRSHEPRQVVGVVGEVAVDRRHELGAGRERPLEAGDVGRAQPLLPLPVEDVEEADLGRQPVGQRAGPVRRGVVDHEHSPVGSDRGQDGPERPNHRLEVLALVVGGDADDQPHARIIAAVPAKLPTNAELAGRFELLADMLELDGADAFRLAAYRRAAARIRDSAVPGRAARAGREGDPALRHRLDHRGQDRGGRRDRRHERPRQAAGKAPAGARGGHARSRPRPEDGAEALVGARRRVAGRPARGGRAGTAAGPARARREDGGEGPEVAGGSAEGLGGDRPHAARQGVCPPSAAQSRRSRPAAWRTGFRRPGASGGAARRPRTST